MLSEETLYLLQQIEESITRIESNTECITDVDDFYTSAGGMMRLESTCMLLIAIGESLKGIDKLTDFSLLMQYPEVDWKGAKGLRDVIAHRYFEIDAEVVFDVVKNKLPIMKKNITRMINEHVE